MDKKFASIFIPPFAIVLLAFMAVVLIFFDSSEPDSILSRLQSEYEDARVIEATFLGYNSKKYSASLNNKKILLQVVTGITPATSRDIMSGLQDKVNKPKQGFSYTDPYIGETLEYEVPHELKPVEERVVINDKEIASYLVYANEIFSTLVFSDSQATRRGMITIYYCQQESSVYRLEVYYEKDEFDKKDALETLNSLLCR